MSDMKAAREAALKAGYGSDTATLNRVIDAYEAKLEKTHTIVPREPTEAMVMHGAAALEPNTFYIDGPPEGRKRQALMAYRAMLNAAEPPPTSQR
jgi:hypothetical protein